jgi:hypothetical protein
VLNALPLADVHGAPSGQASEPQLDHRRFAHARLAADEDHLAGTVGGVLEALLQGVDVGLAPHEGACRQRGRETAVAMHQKPIPLLTHRREILGRRRRVTQRGPNFPHTPPQHRVGNMRSRPDLLLQLGLGHHTAGVLHKVPQHGEGARPQPNSLLPTPQVTMNRVQVKGAKGDEVVLRHRASLWC